MNTAFHPLFAKHFTGIVGQDVQKNQIAKAIYGAKLQEGFMPPILIIAPPGIGKTKILTAAKALYKEIWGDERKAIHCPTGKELGSPTEFFESILIPHVEGADCCFFVDEFHETPAAIMSLFRSMIEVTAARTPKTVRKGEYEVTVNPKRHGFIFATNQIDKIDPALLSRCKRIDLSMYSDDEMEKILFQELKADGINFYPSTLRSIAECNRGTARNIIHWIDSIREHLAFAGKKSLNKEDVTTIIRDSSSFPLGVTKNELATLLILERDGKQKLKELASKNLCDSAEQNANEKFLLQRGLIRIGTEREITAKGMEYLGSLREDKLIEARAEETVNIE